MPQKRTAAYWKKRFEALEAASNRYGQQTFSQIEPAFDAAQRQIQGQIEAWYGRFAKNNQITMQEARKLLSAAELKEFKWDVQEYIKYGRENDLNQMWMKELENASARFHISRLEALKIRTQQAAEVAFGNELDAIDAMARKVFTEDYYHSLFELQKGFGIGWEVGQIDKRKLEKLISKPWTADGKNFSDRIWEQRTQLVSELHNQLTRTCILGKAPDDAIKAISKKFNVSKNQAGRLVMTEQAYFHSVAQQEAFQDLDVEEFEIVATLDSLTSEICQEMDGKHFSMKDYEPGVTAPPFHPWCRSVTVPYFDDNFTGERAARDEETGQTYYVPDSMKYADWKKSLVDGDPSSLKPVDKNDIMNVGTQDRSSAIPASNPDVQKILDRYPVIEGEHTYTDDIKSTNPGYKESKKKKNKLYTHNCQRCVNAYEARRRGYDVTAHARLSNNDPLSIMMSDKGWANVYENGRNELVQCFSRTTEGVKKKVIDQLLDWGNGTRAIVRVQWKGGSGGHVFIAENHDGNIFFLDPQTAETDVTYYFDMAKVNKTHLLRIDNKEFSTLIEDCCDYKLGK